MNLKKLANWNYFPVVRMLAVAAIAFLIILVIILAVSDNPARAMDALFLGPVSSTGNFMQTLAYMVPIVFTALGMNLVLKSGLFNLASDSALYMGAVVSAVIVILTAPLPSIVILPLVILTAGVVGASINVVPALLRRYTGTSEIVVSLMFNFIFFFLGQFIIRETVLDARTGNHSFPFPEEAIIQPIFEGYRLHWGFVIMIFVVIAMYFLVERSKFGYQLRVTGLNRSYAKYSGIKVGMVVLTAQLIGGFLAGAGGTIQLLGMFTRFQWNLLGQVTYVWDGMLVNLIALTKPAYIPLAAFFLAYLRFGALTMSIRSDVDLELITIIQGIVLILIAGERFLYFVKRRREERLALEEKMQEEMAAAAAKEV